MGVPFFKIEAELRKQGGAALSNNYALYADMSNRVMSILARYSPNQEVYSIDECFLNMAGFTDLTAIGEDIRVTVQRWTGLPVCVGFAPTKTLAKLANHVAKKGPAWRGVCDLTALSLGEQDNLVGGLEVGEVWGVGRKISERLAGMGVTTVRHLCDADPVAIRRQFSVVLERTVFELRGISCLALECLALEDAVPPRQKIMVSRSFGNAVFDLRGLEQAVATFVGRAAEKLRGQGSCAGSILVFAQTSPFRDQAQYSRSLIVPLAIATNDTLELTGAALAGLALIFRAGFAYAKAGVMLSELVDQDLVPRDLFASELRPGHSVALMAALDAVNTRFGRGTLTTGAAASNGRWQMRQSRRSPRYTTRWDDLIRVKG